jgi:hypothetical protein
LINGRDTWGVQGSANQTGRRFEPPIRLEPGKMYLYRITGSSMQFSYKWHIDGQSMKSFIWTYQHLPYQTDTYTRSSRKPTSQQMITGCTTVTETLTG